MTGNNSIFHQIAEQHQISLKNYTPLSGGDINDVFLLNGERKFVLKLNSVEKFPGMFEAEKKGLESLKSANVIDVPSPLYTGEFANQSYLILEYREPGKRSKNFWLEFGEQLARLHQQTDETFGFEIDNYIGSLPQYNTRKNTAVEFYMEMRLKPQIDMAEKRGYQLNCNSNFFKNIRNSIPDEPAALIHGDLWNGNFIVNTEGNPCLIDPATAFAPREMDIALMHLFGGFPKETFISYNETFPLEIGWKDRLPLWQLYYLLVHLTIFGTGYLPQVTSIIRKYS